MTMIRKPAQTLNPLWNGAARDHALNGEVRLRAMIEASVDCVITIDAQSTILEFNAAAEQTFGYRREQVIGKPLTEAIIPPSLREAHRRGMAALLKGGTSKLLGKRVEMPAMRSDGSEFPVELTVTQIAGQTPPIFTAYLRDITDRVQAEEALNAQALRYKTLMETSTDSIYVLNEYGDLQEANAAFLRRRGFTAKEVKGLNVVDWDTQWSREQQQERLRKLIGSSAMFETRHRCKDGSVFDVEVCATSVRIGAKQLFFCVTRDISERKQAEEELKREKEILAKIFNNIPVMIGFVGTDGRVSLVNPEWERTIGWTLKELEDQNVDIFAEAYPDPSYRQKVLDFLAAAAGEWADLKIKVRDGHIIDAACAIVHLSDGTKVAIAQDITERKRAAKELEKANHQLRLLSRRLFDAHEEERRHLARELHDEIGQALTAAKINLQSIIANGGNGSLVRLQETSAILDRLLGQVRQISLDLRPSMLDDLGLVPALRSLIDQQGRRASVAGRFSAEDIPENLNPEIQTTCFRIAQEAITNAMRYAAPTQIDVDLRRDNGNLRLLIRDNGSGFDVASAQTQTLGLGLIGIKERAALVGGRAKIISQPNRGTTIEVSVPLMFQRERQNRHDGK